MKGSVELKKIVTTVKLKRITRSFIGEINDIVSFSVLYDATLHGNLICVSLYITTTFHTITYRLSVFLLWPLSSIPTPHTLDEGLKVAGIFADLSKAFDMINHEILLKKLEHDGIRGGTSLLLRSYLPHRKQQVAVETKEGQLQLSDWEFITCGVPQGSILGHLLFILYINDLPGYVHPLKSILYERMIRI